MLTVNETCPVPVVEFGFTKQADSFNVPGIVQVRLIGLLYPVATFTVTLAIAADPTAAVTPGDDSAKSEMVIGTTTETDSV